MPEVRQTAKYSAWFRSLDDRLTDFGPRYRVYFTRIGKDGIVLLVGGDKSSQGADMRIAKSLARDP